MKNVTFSEINPVLWSIFFYTAPQFEQIDGKFSYAKRLFWIQEGKFTLHTKTDTYILYPGDLLHLPSDMRYSTEMDKGVQLANIFFDFFPYEHNPQIASMVFSGAYNSSLAGDTIRFTETDLFDKPFRIPITSEIEKLVQSLIKEETMRMNAYRLRQKALLIDLLVQIYRNSLDSTHDFQNTPTENILQYIVEHCEEPINRYILGEIFHYHPNTICRKVQSVTGMTLHQYIEDTRIQRAQMLLTDTNLQIVDIAHRLQYYDSSHFSASFQKHTGYTPTQWRNKQL